MVITKLIVLRSVLKWHFLKLLSTFNKISRLKFALRYLKIQVAVFSFLYIIKKWLIIFFVLVYVFWINIKLPACPYKSKINKLCITETMAIVCILFWSNKPPLILFFSEKKHRYFSSISLCLQNVTRRFSEKAS